VETILQSNSETVRETGNADIFEAYLAKYPNGQFSDLANIMIASFLTARSAPPID